MRLISITGAKQNVSRLIKEVEAGETVVITRRGKPVAELGPWKSSKLDDPERRAAFERWSKHLRERKMTAIGSGRSPKRTNTATSTSEWFVPHARVYI